MNVPVYTDLGQVYDNPKGIAQRYADICEAFEKAFRSPPDVLARAPGRVNLIGEHIDYEGYGVLPMAIRQDTVVAIRRGGERLQVTHLCTEKYPMAEFDTHPDQEVDTAHHSWANYFVAAYKGTHALLDAKLGHQPDISGLQVLVHGEVPTGSGLSSSAAIICSSMLALLAVYGHFPPPKEGPAYSSAISKADVAHFAAKAEQHVGISCGGMDQAISMMGMKGVAQLVDFNPVRATEVHLPEGLAFVVANSLAVSNKAVGGQRKYNMRVVECRLAAMVLALALGQDKDSISSIKTLREIEPLISKKYGNTGAAVQAVQEILHEGLYSLQEIEELLGVDLNQLYADSAVALKVLEAAREDGGLKLRDRATHVYEESARVHEFKAVCERQDLDADGKAKQLGRLMDASHASCSQRYQCSAPELESLVACAKKCGALGARLTGAGWGGCCVFLVREADADGFVSKLWDMYYKEERNMKVEDLDQPSILFASKPAAGAAVLYLQGLTAQPKGNGGASGDADAKAGVKGDAKTTAKVAVTAG